MRNTRLGLEFRAFPFVLLVPLLASSVAFAEDINFGSPRSTAPQAQTPVSAAPAPAAPVPAACFPECRDGFFCHNGVCLSRCNPPCSFGQQCTAAATCVVQSPAPSVGNTSPEPATQSQTGWGWPASTPTGAAPTPTTWAATQPPAQSSSQNDESYLRKSWAVGGLVGFSTPGTVYMGSGEFDTEMSYVLDAYADAILVPKFSVGVYFTLAPIIPKGGRDAMLISGGVSLKARFALTDRVGLRPGITLGYNSVSVDSSSIDTFMGFNAGVQVDFPIALSRSGSLVPRLGFYSQPVGGNGDISMEFPPIVYIAFGYEFGS